MEIEKVAEKVKEIYGFVKSSYDEKNGTLIAERLTELSSYLAYSAELLSWCQYHLDNARGEASEQALKRFGEKIAPTILKSIVEKESSTANRLFKACERLNRTITHQIDALRSQLSYLKSFND